MNQEIHQYTNTSTKQDIDKVVNSVTSRLDNIEAWLCSVNTVHNLQKDEHQQKQDPSLQQIDIAKIQDPDQDFKRVQDITASNVSITNPQKQKESQLLKQLLKDRSKL